MFFLSDLIDAEFNLQCLEEAPPHGTGHHILKEKLLFFLKGTFKNMQKYECEC